MARAAQSAARDFVGKKEKSFIVAHHQGRELRFQEQNRRFLACLI